MKIAVPLKQQQRWLDSFYPSRSIPLVGEYHCSQPREKKEAIESLKISFYLVTLSVSHSSLTVLLAATRLGFIVGNMSNLCIWEWAEIRNSIALDTRTLETTMKLTRKSTWSRINCGVAMKELKDRVDLRNLMNDQMFGSESNSYFTTAAATAVE